MYDIDKEGCCIVFMQRCTTGFDAQCKPLPPIIENFEMDKDTVYVPVGIISDECPCKEVESLGTVTDFAALCVDPCDGK